MIFTIQMSHRVEIVSNIQPKKIGLMFDTMALSPVFSFEHSAQLPACAVLWLESSGSVAREGHLIGNLTLIGMSVAEKSCMLSLLQQNAILHHHLPRMRWVITATTIASMNKPTKASVVLSSRCG